MTKKPRLAQLIDIALVIVFCAIGRRSHDETGALAGLAHTAWPFLGGLAVGWIAVLALYRNTFSGGPLKADAIVPTGIIVWLSTLVGGMLLRVISGQGTAFSFIIVAAIVLAVFLIGWRGLATAIGSRARKVGSDR